MQPQFASSLMAAEVSWDDKDDIRADVAVHVDGVRIDEFVRRGLGLSRSQDTALHLLVEVAWQHDGRTHGATLCGPGCLSDYFNPLTVGGCDVERWIGLLAEASPWEASKATVSLTIAAYVVTAEACNAGQE